jgi:hypothetical protein
MSCLSVLLVKLLLIDSVILFLRRRYFESNSDAILRALIMGIRHLYATPNTVTSTPVHVVTRPRYPSKLERIPNDSRVDVITIKQTKLQLEMGSFVTLKQFPYKVRQKPNLGI